MATLAWCCAESVVAPKASRTGPSLAVERAIAGSVRRYVAGCDEVGRGALGGPVSVGVAVVDLVTAGEPPEGLADSKELNPRRRAELQPLVKAWVTSWAVGHATAAEIDRWGLTAALRTAGHRALRQLQVTPDVVLLDGRHDWLTAPPQASWLDVGEAAGVASATPPVTTRVKADRDCASVAAASVLAKVTRDLLMADLAVEFPPYAWDENKGYGSPGHLEALARLGPCEHHRRSWRLPVGPSTHTSPDSPSVTSPSTSGCSPAEAGRLTM